MGACIGGNKKKVGIEKVTSDLNQATEFDDSLRITFTKAVKIYQFNMNRQSLSEKHAPTS